MGHTAMARGMPAAFVDKAIRQLRAGECETVTFLLRQDTSPAYVRRLHESGLLVGVRPVVGSRLAHLDPLTRKPVRGASFASVVYVLSRKVDAWAGRYAPIYAPASAA